jgi:hypothetical protein
VLRDPGCLSRILIVTHPGSRISDLGSRIPELGSRIPGYRISDLGSRILDPGSNNNCKRGGGKKFFVLPGSGKKSIPHPGSGSQKSTGSRTRIRTTIVITCPRHNQAGYLAVIHLHTTTAPMFADPVTSRVRIRNLPVFGQDSLVFENP